MGGGEGSRVDELKVTFAGHTYNFEPGQTVRIGRSPENAVVVPDPTVSREHAQVRWQDDRWVLDDLGKGRTYIGGLPVRSVSVEQPLDIHLANPLGPGLRIEIGHDPARLLQTQATAAVAGAGVGGRASRSAVQLASHAADRTEATQAAGDQMSW